MGPRATRPRMPGGYGLLDANQGSGLLLWSFATERMERAHNYWVATARPGGAPHVAPVWGLWMDNAFYFSTDRSSRKGRDLAINPKVAVHLESGDEVVILEGVARDVTDPAVLQRFVEAYDAKYKVKVNVTRESLRGAPVLVVAPRTAYGWLESDFPGGATRWRLDQET